MYEYITSTTNCQRNFHNIYSKLTRDSKWKKKYNTNRKGICWLRVYFLMKDIYNTNAVLIILPPVYRYRVEIKYSTHLRLNRTVSLCNVIIIINYIKSHYITPNQILTRMGMVKTILPGQFWNRYIGHKGIDGSERTLRDPSTATPAF